MATSTVDKGSLRALERQIRDLEQRKSKLAAEFESRSAAVSKLAGQASAASTIEAELRLTGLQRTAEVHASDAYRLLDTTSADLEQARGRLTALRRVEALPGLVAKAAEAHAAALKAQSQWIGSADAIKAAEAAVGAVEKASVAECLALHRLTTAANQLSAAAAREAAELGVTVQLPGSLGNLAEDGIFRLDPDDTRGKALLTAVAQEAVRRQRVSG